MRNECSRIITMRRLLEASVFGLLAACAATKPRPSAPAPALQYEHAETQALVALVADAARLVETNGEAAMAELRQPNSRWRQGDSYVFVFDRAGNMLVHSDSAMEGRSQIDLKDVDGRRVIVGLIQAATAAKGKAGGWYHYQWPAPGSVLARWKSTFVQQALAPSGKRYFVASGMYNDRMERAFVSVV